MFVKMDKFDPICGMRGIIKAHGHYFCSERCLLKYEQEHSISHEKCPSRSHEPKKWYKERLYIVGVILILGYLFNIFT